MHQTPFSHRITALSVLGVVAAMLAACGGGGSGVNSTLPTANSGTGTNAAAGSGAGAQSAQTGTAVMSVLVPSAAAIAAIGRRSPKYISPSTKSMTIGLIAGTATAALSEVDLTPTSPNCAPAPSGGTLCNVSVVAPAGNNQFAVAMYDQIGGKGNILSTATVSATLALGVSTAVPLVLDGIAATVTVIPAVSNLPVGAPGTVLVDVQGYDSAGNIIVGPGAFANPVTLTIAGDPHATLALSTSTISAPNQHIMLAYTGGSLVGATITPSGTGITGSAAAFAGRGVKVNSFIPTYAYQSGSTVSSGALYPADITAFSNGTAAVLYEYRACASGVCYANPIGLVNPTGQQGNFFVGDTSDPYNVPTAVPTPNGQVTIVHGMSKSVQTEPGEGYTTLASGPNNTVFYIADFTSVSYPGCTGTATSGLIGQLNPATGTTTEHVLKGYPYQIRSDANGNVFFTEYAGGCHTISGYTSLFDGTTTYQYAVGELTAAGTVIETQLGVLGIPASANTYPADMAMAPDDSAMYVADYDNQRIIKIPVSGTTFSAAVTAALTKSNDPETIAAGADGSIAWFTNFEGGNQYWWGYMTGAASSFAAGSIAELPFGLSPYYNSYSMTYADGSYFAAGYDYGTGIARMGLAASGPVQAYVPLPYNNSGQEMTGISAADGYVWSGDDDNGNVNVMQYGSLTAGTISPQSTGRASALSLGVKRTTTTHASWNHVHMRAATPGGPIVL